MKGNKITQETKDRLLDLINRAKNSNIDEYGHVGDVGVQNLLLDLENDVNNLTICENERTRSQD